MKINFYKLSTFVCAGFCILQTTTLNAQTIAHFDEIAIPEGFESIGSSLPAEDDTYPFSFISGNIELIGYKEFWAGISAFDCTNSTDNETFDFTNDRSAITGIGSEETENYVIAFLNADWPDNPTSTVPIGFSLKGDAINSYALSVDITNSTYTYFWIMENLYAISFLKITIQGYNEGIPSSTPIEYFLAKIDETDTFVLNTWERINLTSLGEIDSITFKLDSDNDWAPFYFAMDRFVTFDNQCTTAYTEIEMTNLTSTSVTFEHSFPYENVILQLEYAIDETATLAPSGTTTVIDEFIINKDGLDSETMYFYHFRTKCLNEEWSDWDTLHFSTASTSIETWNNENSISIYPNPVLNELSISGMEGINRYFIYNLAGQIILSGEVHNTINLQSISSGNYILVLQNKENQIIFKQKFTKITQ